MTSTIVKLLLQLLLFLMPALEQWIRGMLVNPPPPDVPQELHNTVATLLPAQSASEQAARDIALAQAGSNVTLSSSPPGGTP